MGGERAQTFARRALGGAVQAVDDLTPGQRWTAGLMVALAVVVLAFGMPSPTRLVRPGQAAAASPAAGAAEGDTAEPAAAAAAPGAPDAGAVSGLVLTTPSSTGGV